MKLLLFGGTFDPPHIGHMNLLKSVMELVQPDQVVVMPAGTPPHKKASATPAQWRHEMCACFKALERPGEARIHISDWEIRQGGRSYSIDTIEMLEREYPGAELYLSIGSDMLLSFTTWRRWQDLLAKATLVVESREDGDLPALKAAAEALEPYGGRVLFAHAPALPMASSDIRAGLAGDEALPPPVGEIARKYHLYGR
ncbi:MAG: nicotinate (nicotinamide) nucleotide adenylyltransferase [Oscillospiraceae bacterium]|nr:nicotinate (nicotinamide) nucleotide adenylyltransferase [Oscillospiraceae bacterium]